MRYDKYSTVFSDHPNLTRLHLNQPGKLLVQLSILPTPPLCKLRINDHCRPVPNCSAWWVGSDDDLVNVIRVERGYVMLLHVQHQPLLHCLHLIYRCNVLVDKQGSPRMVAPDRRFRLPKHDDDADRPRQALRSPRTILFCPSKAQQPSRGIEGPPTKHAAAVRSCSR